MVGFSLTVLRVEDAAVALRTVGAQSGAVLGSAAQQEQGLFPLCSSRDVLHNSELKYTFPSFYESD